MIHTLLGICWVHDVANLNIVAGEPEQHLNAHKPYF